MKRIGTVLHGTLLLSGTSSSSTLRNRKEATEGVIDRDECRLLHGAKSRAQRCECRYTH